MILVQLILALVLGAVALAVGGAIIGGILASVAVLLVIGLLIALVVYLFKTHWKPSVTGYYGFKVRTGSFVGKPGIAMDVWRHQKGNTCAINAQRIVLAIRGIHKGEEELAKRQEAYGLHSPDGSIDNMNLMAGYGLMVESVNVGTKQDFLRQLFYALQEGRCAVASVNAELLNNPEPNFVSKHRAVPNHTILLTGLRNIGGGQYRVYYADSGVSDGALKSIDAGVMKEAMGKKIVVTPLLFDGGKRLWPYSPYGLDPVPVGEPIDGKIVASCPQCEKSIRFRLSREARVRCPRCAYLFKAVTGNQSGTAPN